MDKHVEEGLVDQIQSFLRFWNFECEATSKILYLIPEELLHKVLIPDYRSLGRIAWHLIQSAKEMLDRTGLSIDGPKEDEPVPERLESILHEHAKVAKSVKDQVAKLWNDATLKEVDHMYGEEWTKSFTLTVLLFHMAHHRAQMMTLLRLGNAPVVGVYGPAKEEWAKYGMPIPKI